MPEQVLEWYYQVIHSEIFLAITVPAAACAAVYLLYRLVKGVFSR